MNSEMSFCPECNNLLYPKEERTRKELMFLCRQCDHVSFADPAHPDAYCVDRINYNFTSKEDIVVSPDLAKDPTLGRTYQRHCAKCGHQEAVFFQLPERIADDAMTLVFVCSREGCGHWDKQGKDDRISPPIRGGGGAGKASEEEEEEETEEGEAAGAAYVKHAEEDEEDHDAYKALEEEGLAAGQTHAAEDEDEFENNLMAQAIKLQTNIDEVGDDELENRAGDMGAYGIDEEEVETDEVEDDAALFGEQSGQQEEEI
eukprot:GHVT01064852.1.p1 GENE.GHVT01064852.1~~GHVT01064852.1.p1  ORF type:complete len:259 (-),score=76.66 GHVT01064852.1:798-1574(-)